MAKLDDELCNSLEKTKHKVTHPSEIVLLTIYVFKCEISSSAQSNTLMVQNRDFLAGELGP